MCVAAKFGRYRFSLRAAHMRTTYMYTCMCLFRESSSLEISFSKAAVDASPTRRR